jgi:radical SAM-linked protein
MVHYSRTGNVCYLGHLEILQMIFRVLRRAAIPVNYSQGFNPSPKISFGPALPVGTESLAEFFTMDLNSPLRDMEATVALLNTNIIPGMKVTKIELHSGKIPQKLQVTYHLYLNRELSREELQKIDVFRGSTSFTVKKTRKGKTRKIDIRPLIVGCTVLNPAEISLEIVSATAQPGIKPVEAIQEILELDHESAAGIRVKKLSWRCLD